MNINKILRDCPRECKYGAPLGQADKRDSPWPLYLQKVRLVDGDYAPDGTYWGQGVNPLYCAFNGDDGLFNPGRGTRIYMRAANRKEAMEKIMKKYPGIKFAKT
jgi:hypothetical protein